MGAQRQLRSATGIRRSTIPTEREGSNRILMRRTTFAGHYPTLVPTHSEYAGTLLLVEQRVKL
jgi:hypothetical protein